MQPFGLREKAAEKQYAQDHYDRDYYDLDQAHSRFLKVRIASRYTRDVNNFVF